MEINNKTKHVISNISYTFVANLASMLVSIMVILLVPKQLSVEKYGYWQLYLFYTSYAGFLHFGLCDGIYLRYGGKDYHELNKEKFGVIFYVLLIYVITVACIGGCVSKYLVNDEKKLIVILFTFISAVFQLTKTYFSMILQATNRIKEYAICLFIDRGLFGIFVILLLYLRCDNIWYYVIFDIVAKIISLLGLCICCQDIVTSITLNYRFVKDEIVQNIKAGSSLLFANIASLLIIGIIRFAVEMKWSIETFGKVSLTLSLMNFIMSFISMISVVIFPILKKVQEDKLAIIYRHLKVLIVALTILIINLYFPVKEILTLWLPQYSISLDYLALLFPYCVFEAKFNLLLNTYMKILRKEKTILVVNLLTVVCSFICVILMVGVFENLVGAVASIVILGLVKCSLSELFLSRYMNIKYIGGLVQESTMCLVFIIANWFIGGIYGFLIYAIVCIGYCIYNKNKMLETIKYIRYVIK